MTDLLYNIGQALGYVSTGCAIIRPLCKEKRRILLMNIIINALVSANYILIGRFGSACLMCGIAVVQSIVTLIHTKKGTTAGVGEIVIFSLLYFGFGVFGIVSRDGFILALNRDNLLETMPVIATFMLMAAIFTPKEQTTRKLLLVNGLIWTAYGIIRGSSTFMTNLVSATAAAIALIRYRQKNPA